MEGCVSTRRDIPKVMSQVRISSVNSGVEYMDSAICGDSTVKMFTFVNLKQQRRSSRMLFNRNLYSA